MMENVLLAISALKANKMRSLLTMLGIIIGISSVIMIFTVGHSLSKLVEETIAGIGGNRLYIEQRVMDDVEDLTYEDRYTDAVINDDLLQDLKNVFSEYIIDYSIELSSYGWQVYKGDEVLPVNVVGINEGFQIDQQLVPNDGQLFTSKEMDNASNFVMISSRIVEDYFGQENPIGQTLEFVNYYNEKQTFYITGVYSSDSNPLFGGTVASAYIPITKAEETQEDSFINSATLIVEESIDVDTFINLANEYLRGYTKNNRAYSLEVISLGDQMAEFNQMMLTMQLAISAVAGISLVVGGIGVMNIMLVSISERTKEIGTRKALGAQRSDILTQFIVEAIIICLFGGFIGIALGVGGGMLISIVLGFPAVADLNSILIAVIFSMMFGVFFGYYPANKAAKMNPIDALRHE